MGGVVLVLLFISFIFWKIGKDIEDKQQESNAREDMSPIEAAKALLRENKEDYDAKSPYSIWILCSEPQAKTMAESVLDTSAEELIPEDPPILLAETEHGKGKAWAVSERNQFETIKKNSSSEDRVGALPNNVIQLTDDSHLKEFYDLIRSESCVVKRGDSDSGWVVYNIKPEARYSARIQRVLNSEEDDFSDLIMAKIYGLVRESLYERIRTVYKVWIICEDLKQANDIADASLEARVVDKLPQKLLKINPSTKRGKGEVYLLSNPEHHGDILKSNGTPELHSSVYPDFIVCLPGEKTLSEFKDQIGNLEKADTVTPN